MKFLGPPSSGSQGGTTSSRNRFGQYTRSRSTPVNPNSPAQVAVREAFGNGARSWKTLTQGQRDAWNTSAGSNPVTDSLGQTQFLTGFQFYVGTFTTATQYGQVPPTSPPASPSPSPTPFGFTDVSISVAGDYLLNTENAPVVAVFVGIYASPPYSVGTSFVGDFRLLKVQDISDPETGISFKTKYIERFGAPGVGQRVSVRPSMYVGGLLLPKGQFECTVTA